MSGGGREYFTFLADLKERITKARYRAIAFANRESVGLYRYIGHGIADRQERFRWGDAVVQKLSNDLRAAFPDMRGFSATNLWMMRRFYMTYKNNKKLQTLSEEIGWSQNVLILLSSKDIVEQQFYLSMAGREGWSYRELKRQIDSTISLNF